MTEIDMGGSENHGDANPERAIKHHRKFFWGYEIDRPLSVSEIAELSDRTGVKYLHRYFDKHEYVMGSATNPGVVPEGVSAANEVIRLALGNEQYHRPILSATRGMYREEGRMLEPKEGIQFFLYALEEGNELADIDINDWEERRQAVAEVVAELGGREIPVDEITF